MFTLLEMYMEMGIVLLHKSLWMMFKNNICGILFLEDYGKMPFSKQSIILSYLQLFVFGISVRMIKDRVEKDQSLDHYIGLLDII